VSYGLLAAYWVSYVAVARDPDGGWAQIVSFFPGTAPFAMPARIALGAIEWWEPVLAAVLTGAAIAGLVVLAGRVYTGAILHTGTRLTLRDAWRRTAPGPS
jgi:ABC-2 type transport system permease protein